MTAVRRVVVAVLLLPVRVYRLLLSPLLGPHCRFAPSCSSYAVTALETHGPLRGSVMALRRISRCHPWHPGGHDPVPPSPGTPQSRSRAGAHS